MLAVVEDDERIPVREVGHESVGQRSVRALSDVEDGGDRLRHLLRFRDIGNVHDPHAVGRRVWVGE